MKLGDYKIADDDELDELAIITDEDVLVAQAEWKLIARRWAKNLLLASQPEALKDENE